MKSFCFFFQKEALSFLKKRNKKLLSIGFVRPVQPVAAEAFHADGAGAAGDG